jgi:hypothetical protein
MLTQQEIFNRVYTGLKAQGFKRSLSGPDDAVSRCRYRGEDGLKCAIGHLIPDEKYEEGLEGLCASVVEVRNASGTSGIDWNFLDDLQVCHDEGNTPADMERLLKRFAADYELVIEESI